MRVCHTTLVKATYRIKRRGGGELLAVRASRVTAIGAADSAP